MRILTILMATSAMVALPAYAENISAPDRNAAAQHEHDASAVHGETSRDIIVTADYVDSLGSLENVSRAMALRLRLCRAYSRHAGLQASSSSQASTKAKAPPKLSIVAAWVKMRAVAGFGDRQRRATRRDGFQLQVRMIAADLAKTQPVGLVADGDAYAPASRAHAARCGAPRRGRPRCPGLRSCRTALLRVSPCATDDDAAIGGNGVEPQRHALPVLVRPGCADTRPEAFFALAAADVECGHERRGADLSADLRRYLLESRLLQAL